MTKTVNLKIMVLFCTFYRCQHSVTKQTSTARYSWGGQRVDEHTSAYLFVLQTDFTSHSFQRMGSSVNEQSTTPDGWRNLLSNGGAGKEFVVLEE